MVVASKIVEDVLEDLNGRSGFDAWWYEVEPGIQQELKEELTDKVHKRLQAEGVIPLDFYVP